MFAIVPQLSLTYQQRTITRIMTYYLMMLGSYRGFYILNWLYRYHAEGFWEPVSFYCGCTQSLIYFYFFIHIYPQLTNENQWQSIDITKDSMNNINVKENINQVSKHDTPLLHNVV
ncbi:unnamed protein product [Rotaria magnacalcarata]|uniref:Uncharacterized protein n=1 Tax=Rotaria magnacalcarata TaxID=392030 RepID=A0A816T1J3_9BILA|nr:unnamed protein product [Rotaria magnacalcarata]